MAEKRYQVTAECAHVVTETAGGIRSQVLLYRGAFLPEDVAEDRIEFLLDSGLIGEAGATPLAPNAAVQQDPRRGVDSVTSERLKGGSDAEVDAATRAAAEQAEADAEKAKADAEVAEKRAAARAKLPADGSAPHGNAAQAVWVEYVVGRGQDYDTVKDVDRDELKALAEQQK